jgi:polysaccharide biosynthesis protein PslH
MRILVLSTKVPYPAKDGGAIATLSLATGLAKCGATVDLLAMNTSKHRVDINCIPEKITKLVFFYSVDIDTTIKPVEALHNLFLSRQPYNAVRFLSNDYRNKLIDLLEETKYDIVQLEGAYLLPYIPVIREYSKAVISFRAHNIEHEIWRRNFANESHLLKKLYTWILYKRIKRFEKNHLNSYDLIVPITERDASAFMSLGNCKPAISIPTGIETGFLPAWHAPNEDVTFFFLGALDWIPNQEGLLWFIDEVWETIIQQMPDLTLHVAGRNAPRWLAEKLIDTKGIIFYGEIEDARTFMMERTVMIVPLLAGSGMRIKIIEGMSLGRVIISTSIGAEGINVQHETNILLANSKDEFFASMNQCLENKKKIVEISSNAHTFIKSNYDNLTISRRLLDIYDTLISTN